MSIENGGMDHYKHTILSLEALVRVVSTARANSKISITLNVHGSVISGDLVSSADFHKYLESTLLENLQEKEDPTVYQPLKAGLEALVKVSIMNVEGDLNLQYVCVKDAKIYLSHIHTASAPFWIGKIESVDGFSLGSIESPSSAF